MQGSTWGLEGPPQEAYSRITHPERFAPLHGFAEELLARLMLAYDVEREEGYDLEPTLEPGEMARSSIKLVPRSQDASPLLVSFTKFPGLVIQIGRWYREPFPSCGCDACDETSESTIEELNFLVRNVTAGHFIEEVLLPPLVGSAWLSTEIGSRALGGWRSSRTRIRRAEAGRMLRGGRRRYDWKPWPKR